MMWKHAVVRTAIGATAILIGLSVQASAQETYQYRDSWNYNDRPYNDSYAYHDGYYRDGYYSGYYDGGPVVAGAAVAGDIVKGAGEVVGAAGSVVAGPPYYAQADESYCVSRFKSYDPASGTYLGYDGQRHPCP
jgi:hypothetical protein